MLDAVVVGVPDEKWGQRVAAYIVRSDPELTAAGLEEFCLAHPGLADFKRPRGYRFVDEVPVTATGKKMHYKVADLAAADWRAGRMESPAPKGDARKETEDA